MYHIEIRGHFDSAHRLRGYPGNCSNLHGHRWEVALTFKGKKLDNLGMTVDFKILKGMLKEILSAWDHKNLEEIPPFDNINPTAENLARILFEKAQTLTPAPVELVSVSVWETPHCLVTYTLEGV